MSKFAKKAKSFRGVITGIDGKRLAVQVGDELESFTVEGTATEELQPGHEVTVVTWGDASAVRVVNHTTNTIYRPFYNPDPEGENLAEGNRSDADALEPRMGLTTLLPTVFLATIFQSIPIYGWYVTYKMIAGPDKSLVGTAPQYADSAKRNFILFVVLAFAFSIYTFANSGDVVQAVLIYMTILYVGTFSLMRTIFKGIEEIDHYTRYQLTINDADGNT